MELLEYCKYFAQRNETIEKLLESIESTIGENETISEEDKKNFYLALGFSKGYVEYKTKTLAENLGVSKGNIKFMINTLVEEGKIEIIKEHNITFIKIK